MQGLYCRGNGQSDRLLQDPGPHPLGVARGSAGTAQAARDHALISTISLLVAGAILPGVSIGRPRDAVVAVILMALFNAIVRPVLLTFVAPRSLVLLGVLVLVLQVVTFLVIAPLANGVPSTGSSRPYRFVRLAAVNTALTSILGVDRGGSYFGLLVSNLMANRAGEPTDKPGLVIIQIDGLAHPILASRIRAGSVNTMGGWVRRAPTSSHSGRRSSHR